MRFDPVYLLLQVRCLCLLKLVVTSCTRVVPA
jgi:hypothetical protein